MATKKSPAVKSAKKAKTAVANTKTSGASKKTAAGKTAAKPAPKKAVATAKKAVKATKAAKPAKVEKKVAAKSAKATTVKASAKKAAPTTKKAAVTVKKVAGKKNTMTKKTEKTVNKKAVKKVEVKKETVKATEKKAAVKKVAEKNVAAKATEKSAVSKKEVSQKKPAAPVKAEKTPAKKVAPAAVAPKKAAPKKSTAKAEPIDPVAKAEKVARTAARTGLPVMPKAQAPVAKPAPVVESTQKKPAVVIARRKLENKSKKAEEAGKTMINYQPEFTRSVLDEPAQSGPVYRYSDDELAEFKELILGRLEAARKELGYLQGLITRKDEAGTEDTENRFMNMEDGSGAMEREQLAQLASRQIQFINHLEKALIRIENKTYGICRVTGKLIDKARLRAVPHATLSIEAKKTMTK